MGSFAKTPVQMKEVFCIKTNTIKHITTRSYAAMVNYTITAVTAAKVRQ
jgi:hypothetical protein